MVEQLLLTSYMRERLFERASARAHNSERCKPTVARLNVLLTLTLFNGVSFSRERAWQAWVRSCPTPCKAQIVGGLRHTTRSSGMSHGALLYCNNNVIVSMKKRS